MDFAVALLGHLVLVLCLAIVAVNTAIAVRPLTTVVLDVSQLLEFVEIHSHLARLYHRVRKHQMLLLGRSPLQQLKL